MEQYLVLSFLPLLMAKEYKHTLSLSRWSLTATMALFLFGHSSASIGTAMAIHQATTISYHPGGRSNAFHSRPTAASVDPACWCSVDPFPKLKHTDTFHVT